LREATGAASSSVAWRETRQRDVTLGDVTDRADKEAWARENVHLNSAEHTGKYSLTWVARLNVDGMLFEQRVRGDDASAKALVSARQTRS
jgi:hypothetical protein